MTWLSPLNTHINFSLYLNTRPLYVRPCIVKRDFWRHFSKSPSEKVIVRVPWKVTHSLWTLCKETLKITLGYINLNYISAIVNFEAQKMQSKEPLFLSLISSLAHVHLGRNNWVWQDKKVVIWLFSIKLLLWINSLQVRHTRITKRTIHSKFLEFWRNQSWGQVRNHIWIAT